MRDQLLRSDRFHLEIDGYATASFLRCSGLGAEREVFVYREGGADIASILPGSVRPSTLAFEVGLTRGGELFSWFERGDRRDGAVVLESSAGEEQMRWEFERGVPIRWLGPQLDAGSAAVAIERIELAHEGLRCRVG